MSGICGLYNLDCAPVSAEDLRRMTALLERRGPDGTDAWRNGSLGLGYTLLATTPELVFERQPLEHAASGCVIVADVRLDNRKELLAALGLSDRAGVTGDAGLILAAYLAWGESCVERFLGDFAFVIHDSRRQALFCARDQMGMRPFNYHHTPGKFFAFATEPRAILVLPQTPYRINEGRIADFLLADYLEDVDKTSTFFEDVYRLPPAHTLSVTPKGLRLRRYWRPEPAPELRLPSDEAYAEAFLEVFTEAVRCRLRSAGPVASMLSGGVDSGSVVGVARELLANGGNGPLHTFSGVGPDPDSCLETFTIHEASAMEGLDPQWIDYEKLDEWLPELATLSWSLEEPFDDVMTLLRVLYLAAHQRGIKIMLDGVASDVVLYHTGDHLARLLRRGSWSTAWREAKGMRQFYGGAYRPSKHLYLQARRAFIPAFMKRTLRMVREFIREERHIEKLVQKSFMNPEFAARVDLRERLRSHYERRPIRGVVGTSEEQAMAVDSANLAAGRERYDRTASAVAVEPRDPYLDRRLVEWSLSLPGEQKQMNGWPKIILRRALAGRLPEPVRWRKGRTHLGWRFNARIFELTKSRIDPGLSTSQIIRAYVDVEGLSSERPQPMIYYLSNWLSQNARRPCP